jgi:hypothetical protein
MVTLRPAYMAHLRRPLLVLATLCSPFEYLDDPLTSMRNCKTLEVRFRTLLTQGETRQLKVVRA